MSSPLRAVPRFPILGEPGTWDRLTLLAATAWLEAEGEPYLGKLGVVWVVMNRVRVTKADVHAVILGRDRLAYGDDKPFEAWSCFNDNEQKLAERRLIAADGPKLEECWRAAAAGLWGFEPDPTHGAFFYLNVPVTQKLRKNGTLPEWFHEDRVTVVIDHHTFVRA